MARLNRVLVAAFAAFSCWAPTSAAIVVQIGEFGISRNGIDLLDDQFNNGTTPSQEPARYSVLGAFPNGAENAQAGRLTLNSDWGALTTNGAGAARRALITTGLTPPLTQADTIEVFGVFTLVTPPGPLVNGYGVQVRDQIALGRSAEMDVLFRPGDGDEIAYILQDFVAGTTTTLASVPLGSAPPDATYIALGIIRPNSNSHNFFGEYVWGDSSGNEIGPVTQLQNPAALFVNTNQVQGRFVAFSAVPEPATTTLLVSGLAALALRRKRRQ